MAKTFRGLPSGQEGFLVFNFMFLGMPSLSIAHVVAFLLQAQHCAPVKMAADDLLL